MTTGYSGTPLAKKLGIKDGFYVLTVNEPDNYSDLVAPLPATATLSSGIRAEVDMITYSTNGGY